MKTLSAEQIADLIGRWHNRMLARDSEVRTLIETGLSSRSLHQQAQACDDESGWFADTLSRLVPAPYDPELPESETYSPSKPEQAEALAELAGAMTAPANEDPESNHLPLLDRAEYEALDPLTQRLLAKNYAQAAHDVYLSKRDNCLSLSPPLRRMTAGASTGHAAEPRAHRPVAIREVATGRGATPLAEALKAYESDQARTQRAWAEGPPDKARGAFADLLAVTGDIAVAAVKREDCERYRRFAELRGNRKRQGLPTAVNDVLAGRVPEDDRRTPKTVEDELGNVTRFFGWLRDNHYIETSPAEGLSAAAHEPLRREPWTASELAALLDPENWSRFLQSKTQDRARQRLAFLPWLTTLAVYTGARIGELAGLTPADVQERHPLSAGRVPVVLVVPNDTRRLKTASAARAVPIHPDLEALGLFDLARRRAEAGAATLLEVPPKGPRVGNGGTDAFSNYSKFLGLHRHGEKVFHSLRHGLKTSLEGTMVKSDLDLVLGHKRADAAGDAYTHAPRVPLDRHYEAFKGLRTGLDLDRVRRLLDSTDR